MGSSSSKGSDEDMGLAILFQKLKGGPGSGNHGHSGGSGGKGNPGGSSGKSSLENNISVRANEIYTVLRSYDTLNDIPDNILKKISEEGSETIDIYGEPSRAPIVENYINHPFGYFSSLTNKVNEKGALLQEKILDSKISKNETLYRGIYGPHAEELNAMKVGDTITFDKTFTSASRSKKVAEIFSKGNKIIQIDIKKGQNALFVDENGSEFVLPAGITFKKLSHDKFEVLRTQ